MEGAWRSSWKVIPATLGRQLSSVPMTFHVYPRMEKVVSHAFPHNQQTEPGEGLLGTSTLSLLSWHLMAPQL